MSTPSRLPIAVTCGDPAGVGPAIIARYLKEHPQMQRELCVLGPRHWLSSLPGVRTLAVGDRDFQLRPGTPTVEGANIAAEALEEAALGCRQGRYRSVVTAPVSKEWMNRVGWNYPGQTEYFADRWFGQPSMAFAGGRLRVVLATWHVPFSEVPTHLTHDSIERAVRNAAFLAKRLQRAQNAKHGGRESGNGNTASSDNATGNEPRIAVCGLNPHAGEGGLLGFEEQGIIDPVLDTLRSEFPGLSRCLPGDTVFWRQLQGEFDVIIAMYHDQGLAPLKTLEFDQSVNLTLGLPFIRTSPDHGTAFALAAQPDAKISIESFARAVELADELTYAV